MDPKLLSDREKNFSKQTRDPAFSDFDLVWQLPKISADALRYMQISFRQ